MKYLKYFEEASDYEAYKNGSDYVLPNVSYIVDGADIKFNTIKWGKVIVHSDHKGWNSGFNFNRNGGLIIKQMKINGNLVNIVKPSVIKFTINHIDEISTQGYFNDDGVKIAMVKFMPKTQLPSNVKIQWYCDGEFYRNENRQFFIDNNNVYISDIQQEVANYRIGQGYLVTPILLNTDTNEVIPCDMEIISEHNPNEIRLCDFWTDDNNDFETFIVEYLIDENILKYTSITNSSNIGLFGGDVLEFYPISTETA